MWTCYIPKILCDRGQMLKFAPLHSFLAPPLRVWVAPTGACGHYRVGRATAASCQKRAAGSLLRPSPQRRDCDHSSSDGGANRAKSPRSAALLHKSPHEAGSHFKGGAIPSLTSQCAAKAIPALGSDSTDILVKCLCDFCVPRSWVSRRDPRREKEPTRSLTCFLPVSESEFLR